MACVGSCRRGLGSLTVPKTYTLTHELQNRLSRKWNPCRSQDWNVFLCPFCPGWRWKKEVFTRRKYIAFCSNTSKRAAPFSHATRSETMSPNEAATLITLAVFAAMVLEIVHQTCKTKRYVQYSFLSFSLRVEQLCESRGGRPWLSVLMKLTVCVNVKQRCP